MVDKILVSIIVPTYKERENIPELISRIDKIRGSVGFDIELIIVDDDSQDGSEEYVNSLSLPWCRIYVRKNERGLSSAVLKGFELASGEILVVMDADLSHPPEKIVDMVQLLQSGEADMVVGSRYVPGASTDEEWGLLRRINSIVATLLAKPLTSVKDPMSGFFALKKQLLKNTAPLNPTGYKIGLELLVKCPVKKIVEVPIHFAQRAHGKSKLTLKEQINYLIHLRRLYFYKYENLTYFLHFAIVGFSGTIVNLIVLTLLVLLGIPVRASVALAIVVAMLSNFILNRWLTFPHARESPWLPQLLGFVSACSLGAVVNYITVLLLLYLFPLFEKIPQIPALIGILAGLIFNFVLSKNFVFKKWQD
ncbi:MAG: glycosyltransferase family 2 protein [Candidatus Hydrogenedentes bacterium]|nr:glycosyltransferase family 2 protein [Candidatus Hydrogenedentota bacterium]